MWDALKDVARSRRLTLHDLVTEIDGKRSASSLTAAIRVYIVDHYRTAAFGAGRPPAVPPSRVSVQNAAC